MKINNVELSISAVRQSQYPNDNKKEFLLVGRSNVGKSSFINSIIERRNLARVSSKPGKTQTLNFYNINNDFYLVDVPGYGYASVSRETQEKFGKMIEEYIENRENLKRVFMLVDFRIKPTQDDLLMYNFLKYYNLPVTIVTTKVDKVSRNDRDKQVKLIKETLDVKEGDRLVLFSIKTKLGKADIHKEIEEIVYEEEK
ncbi:MAG: YihA family ribosome biogenesis GTP-binding protein [Bacilli bacterium]|nr:YihA family ribosome biogenesis GTP-binding protein [Bacilli bacterium]